MLHGWSMAQNAWLLMVRCERSVPLCCQDSTDLPKFFVAELGFQRSYVSSRVHAKKSAAISECFFYAELVVHKVCRANLEQRMGYAHASNIGSVTVLFLLLHVEAIGLSSTLA